MLPQFIHPSRNKGKYLERKSQPVVLSPLLKLLTVLGLILIGCPWTASAEDDLETSDVAPPQWRDYLGNKAVSRGHTIQLGADCDVQTYNYFNEQLRIPNTDRATYKGQIGNQYDEYPLGRNHRNSYMVPKILCISTDNESYIDLHRLDCVPNKLDPLQIKGYCTCSQQLSTIDENFKGSYGGRNQKEFYHVWKKLKGLNRLLTMQPVPYNKTAAHLVCVASRFGHCTLPNQGLEKRRNWEGKPWVITKCARHYKCLNISVWNPIEKHPLYNPNTKEWWGVCVSESTNEITGSPFGSGGECAVFNNGHHTILGFCLVSLVILRKLLSGHIPHQP